MSLELTDEQLKASIMQFLVKKGRWGAHCPVDAIVNWMSKRVRRDGKRVRLMIKDLVKDGYLFVHKRGDTILLNSARSKDMMELLKVAPE